jgi:hypothetical protein
MQNFSVTALITVQAKDDRSAERMVAKTIYANPLMGLKDMHHAILIEENECCGRSCGCH